VSGLNIDGATMEAFNSFYKTYQRNYEVGSPEFFRRMEIFAGRMEEVAAMNKEHVAAAGYAVFGVTKFSDLSHEEFASMYLNSALKNTTIADSLPRTVLQADMVPNDVDWRTQGAVTAVKDQMQCGSCWAFSATEALESFAHLAGHGLEILAPQQIVSCDKTDSGCNGGWPYNAFNYVKGAGGMEHSTDYPYTSGGGSTGVCKFDSSKVVSGTKPTGYVNVAKGEDQLATALAKGPVSVCVDAATWSSYRSGVLSTCGSSVDHAVQAVGFTADYWIVRNSWGTSWGESGYIRLARGKNLCLISSYVTYPTF
jgi:cathepsin F/cysteine peptidase B